MGWPKDESILEGADAILIYADGGQGHPAIQQKRMQLIHRLASKGVGIGCAHYGVEVPDGDPGKALQDWIGGHYEHQFSVNPMWEPDFTTFPDHPITRGVKPFKVLDEWYFNMRFREDMAGVTPILTATPSEKVRQGPYVWPKDLPHIVADKGRAEVMMWVRERPDGGRGFGFTGGHRHANWGNDSFRKVVLNALLWVAKVEVPPNGVVSFVTEEDLKEIWTPSKGCPLIQSVERATLARATSALGSLQTDPDDPAGAEDPAALSGNRMPEC